MIRVNKIKGFNQKDPELASPSRNILKSIKQVPHMNTLLRGLEALNVLFGFRGVFQYFFMFQI
jgi:hypothetical protein